MRTNTRLLLLMSVGLALAVAGVSRPPSAASASGEGKLIVREHQLPAQPGDGIYIEGYVSFLRVRSLETGEIVTRQRIQGRVHLDTTLPQGDYRVTRYIRPCDANCGYLDAKTERCSAPVSVADGDPALAVVRTRTTHPCEVRVR
jgi:hypothetical protein